MAKSTTVIEASHVPEIHQHFIDSYSPHIQLNDFEWCKDYIASLPEDILAYAGYSPALANDHASLRRVAGAARNRMAELGYFRADGGAL